MGKEYRRPYGRARVTSAQGLGALVARFLQHCAKRDVRNTSLSLSRGGEQYGFESLDEMLRSPVLGEADGLNVWVTAKSGEQLHVYWLPHLGAAVSAQGMDEDVARQVIRCAESDLGLEPIPVEPTPDRSVFLAHSFDSAGKLVANVLRDFLGLLGFRVVTGEAYSPRGVSSKIRDRIHEQAIAVCILTRRRGTEADAHRTSQWVLAEAAVAEGLEKPVFLLIEKGVEAEIGIHGDREYIQFTMRSLQAVIIKLLQGLRELGYEFVPGD